MMTVCQCDLAVMSLQGAAGTSTSSTTRVAAAEHDSRHKRRDAAPNLAYSFFFLLDLGLYDVSQAWVHLKGGLRQLSYSVCLNQLGKLPAYKIIVIIVFCCDRPVYMAYPNGC